MNINIPSSFSLDSETDRDLVEHLDTLPGRTRSEFIRAALRLKIAFDRDGTRQQTPIHDILQTPVQAVIPPKVMIALEQIQTELRGLKAAIEHRPWPVEGEQNGLEPDELAELESNLDAALNL